MRTTRDGDRENMIRLFLSLGLAGYLTEWMSEQSNGPIQTSELGGLL